MPWREVRREANDCSKKVFIAHLAKLDYYLISQVSW